MGYYIISAYQQAKRPFGPVYVGNYRQFEANRDLPLPDTIKFKKQAKYYYRNKPILIYNAYLSYEKILKNAEKFGLYTQKLKFNTANNKKLINWLQKFKSVMGKTMLHAYGYYFYQYLGDELFSILAKHESDPIKITKYFEIFTQSKDLSAMQKETLELLLLLRKINKFNYNLDSKNAAELINNHLEKFAYMGMHYFRGKPWQPADIKRRLRHWQKNDYELEIKNLKKIKINNNNWQTIAKHLKFSSKDILLVKILKQMSYCTNFFDEVWNYCVYSGLDLLHAIAKKVGVTYQQMISMDIDEVLGLLSQNKKASSELKQEIARRENDSLILMTKNDTFLLSGEELKKYKKLVKTKKISFSRQKIYKGQVASVGKAIGHVKIVFDSKDLSKVKTGDILVAKMTVPSFLPAMEKAAGIVVEVGGLLTHAAIVSRELRKPCVVGIDGVTELFKDGDKVEVDAEKGKVKIL